jgi:hypothetical protein
MRGAVRRPNAALALNGARRGAACAHGARIERIGLTVHVFDIPPQQGL